MKTLLKITALSAVLLILAGGLASCKNKEESPLTTLEGTNWKLVGIVDVETGDLRILEPKDCERCYVLSFDTDNTVGGNLADNIMFGYYEVDYKTRLLHFTEIAYSEMNTIWYEYELLYGQFLEGTQSFIVNDICRKILHLYYNDGKKYLKYTYQPQH